MACSHVEGEDGGGGIESGVKKHPVAFLDPLMQELLAYKLEPYPIFFRVPVWLFFEKVLSIKEAQQGMQVHRTLARYEEVGTGTLQRFVRRDFSSAHQLWALYQIG